MRSCCLQQGLHSQSLLQNLQLIITTFGILIAVLLLEFIVPMSLGNGQTIGKKVFAIGVMRQEGVKVNGVCMFIRTVLGKYAIEPMVPVLMVLMLFFGSVGEVGWIIVGVIVIAEIVLLATTKEHCMIHDKLANTVTVDLPSQMIFNTQEELIAYK